MLFSIDLARDPELVERAAAPFDFVAVTIATAGTASRRTIVAMEKIVKYAD